jgi:iron complex outermembrane receptor protein
MKKMYSLVVAMSLAAVFSHVVAQQTISGKVTNQKSEALTGATVTAKPSGKTAVSSATGIFELLLSAGDQSLIVSSVGYETKTVAINGNNNYEIQLSPNITQLEDFVVVGSRKAQRSKFNSIAPVDVVKLSDVRLQVPQIGTNELLNQLVPSFNASRQSASDGTEHIDPASLRGLGPDQVLVLINGKRRHTTSLINYQNTVGNGAVGTDLNAIPTSAIDRIEVLRDGAAAQYGSDAIAGVINIILKKNTGLTASVTGGGASRGDGGLVNLNANYGVGFNKDKGFLNLTFEANRRGATSRTQNQDLIIYDQSANGDYFAYAFANDAAASRAYDDSVLAARNLSRDDFNFHVGDAKAINYQGFANFGYQISTKTELYAFTGISVRNGTGYGFRRLPGETQNVVASIFPNGFQPTLNSDILDFSLSAGIRQQLGSSWKLDLSNTYGRNSFGYHVKNSNNSSLGALSPTEFNAGSHAFAQNTVNADISKTFESGTNTVNLAFGGEYRLEKYSITKGQDESWKLYTTNPSGIAGAQSFPGFTPENEVNASRHSVAAYADADFSFNKNLLVATAVRFENYSDFGSTINGKLGIRYNISDAFALRGSVSTGFRAPSLHQQYFSNFYSDIAQDGSGIINKGIFPINSAVAKAIGLPDLKQETSINYSAGFTAKPAKNFVITADAYLINIKDRIVITSSISDDRISALGVESGRFFTNAIDTRTKGIDVVATYTVPFSKVTKLDIALASNFNKTSITKFHFPASLGVNGLTQNDYFGPDQKSLIETNNPTSKHTLSLNLTADKFNFLVRNIYWGKVTRDGYPFGVVQEHKGKITTDVAVSYKILKGISFTVGANNILDVFPDKQAYDNSYFGVFKYAPVQMGVLGAFYYARVNLSLN